MFCFVCGFLGSKHRILKIERGRHLLTEPSFPVLLCLRRSGQVEDRRTFPQRISFTCLSNFHFSLAVQTDPEKSGKWKHLGSQNLSCLYSTVAVLKRQRKRAPRVGVWPRRLKQNLGGSVRREDSGIENACSAASSVARWGAPPDPCHLADPLCLQTQLLIGAYSFLCHCDKPISSWIFSMASDLQCTQLQIHVDRYGHLRNVLIFLFVTLK